MDTNETSNLQGVVQNLTRNVFELSSTSFTLVGNFTIPTSRDAAVLVDVETKFSKDGNPTVNVECYLEEPSLGERTPVFGSALEGSNIILSTGNSHITSNETRHEDGHQDWEMYCKSSNTDKVNINSTVYQMELVDSIGDVIQHFQNDTEIVRSFTGSNNLISSITDYTVRNGTEMLIITSLDMESLSGSQEGTSGSPRIYVNRTGATDACLSSVHNSIHANGEEVTVKFYDGCPVDVGSTYDFNVWLDVAIGETVQVNNISFDAYETSILNISQGNVPPEVVILVPEEGANVTGVIQVNWTATDPNNNRFLQNLTVSNGTDNILIAQDIPDSIFNQTWNTTAFADGFWDVTITVVENDTTLNFVSNDTIRVRVLNELPTVNILIPVDGSTIVDTTFVLNYTVNGNGLDVLFNCWYNIDNGPNNTITCGANVTGLTTTDGSHTISVFANNTVGAIGSDTNTFNFVNVAVKFFLSRLFPNNEGLPFLKGGESNDFR